MAHEREDMKGLFSAHGLSGRRDLPAPYILTTRKLAGPQPYPPPLRVPLGDTG